MKEHKKNVIILRKNRWKNRLHIKTSWKNGQWKDFPRTRKVSTLIPNLVTVASMGMGLSAIQFGFLGQWRNAVGSILTAALLDGIDGRLARFLKVSSEFGAELDSLADFINFGVAPALVVYFSTLHHWGSRGWWLCLFFCVCMALRLARFNVQRHQTMSALFSTGIPAPAGALLILMPLITSFVFDTLPPVWFQGATIFFTALMLISRYPTFVFKKIKIPTPYVSFFSASALATIAGLVSAPWETLLLIGITYLLMLPISGYVFYCKGYR